MFVLDVISLIAIVVLIVCWLYYRFVRRYRYTIWTKAPKLLRAKRHFETLFREANGFAVSKAERDRLGLLEDHFTYGEVTFLSFAAALQIVRPKVGEAYYDLGSGSGKALFIVALLYDLKKICGIEYFSDLCQQSEALREKFYQLTKRPRNIHIVNSDFFKCDYSDADIIFVNATCFNNSDWLRIVSCLEHLKKGARVIVATKSIASDHYRLIDRRLRQMSWGQCTTSIYLKDR